MTRAGATPTVAGPDETETTESAIVRVFREFDPASSGRVPLSVLLHALAEVDSASALGVDEVHDLLRLTGVLNETTLRDPRTLYAMEVDYRAFVRHLLFAPAAPAAAPAGGAAALAPAPAPAAPAATRAPSLPVPGAVSGRPPLPTGSRYR
jgi:hypothetical protein